MPRSKGPSYIGRKLHADNNFNIGAPFEKLVTIRYADDMLLMSTSLHDLVHMITHLAAEFRAVGLEFNL
eukprot:16438131-Heterocapsa_arctica.AAC.1